MKTVRTTPQWLVDKIWQYLIDFEPKNKLNSNILEPSAGEGNLLNPSDQANAWIKYDTYNITAIELNKEKADKCKHFLSTDSMYEYANIDVIHGDFLNVELKEKYNQIIAAPPFNNNIDVLHIQKMYDVCEPGGIIITLTSPYWMTNNEAHQVAFREWLKDKQHTIEMLPDMTFVEKEKTVPTAIMIFKKQK